MNKRSKVKVLKIKYSDYTTKTIYEYDAEYINDIFNIDIQDKPQAAGYTLSANTIEVIKKREEAEQQRQNDYNRYKQLL
jgi:hypothetical protein